MPVPSLYACLREAALRQVGSIAINIFLRMNRDAEGIFYVKTK